MTKIRARRRKNIYAELWIPGGENKCFYCREDVPRKLRTIDHLTPHADGGSTDMKNVVLACRPCNSAKADFTIAEFAEFVAQQGGIKRVKEIWGQQPQSKKHLLL